MKIETLPTDKGRENATGSKYSILKQKTIRIIK